MAGRPAAVRSGGGGNGLLYGLIAFAIVSVLALGGFIFALTNLQQAKDEAAKLGQRLRALGSAPPYYADEATARGSNAFAVINADFEDVAELVTGNRASVRPAIQAEARRVLATVAQAHPQVAAKRSLIESITSLSALVGEMKAEKAATAEQLAALQAEREALTAGLKETADEFQAQVAALSEELARIGQEKTTALDAKDRQLDEFRATNETQAREWNAEKAAIANERRQNEIDIGRMNRELVSLQTQVQSLKGGALDPNGILRKADGKIVRAIPGSSVVYVDIGRADNLKAGTTFEVYPPGPESRESVRGKASLEVVTVNELTSECVVRRETPGQPIVEGDLVANIAFERRFKPRFLVRGSFDLNYDGEVDQNDRDRVSAVIRDWGGQVVDELDANIDFVVVGVAPLTPELPPGTQISPVVQVQLEQQKAVAEAYDQVIDKARGMSIPVITQSQLLFLTGYAGETTIRPR